MSRFVGEVFDASVSSVGPFGMFVMLENTCEGLVPMSDMPFGTVFDEKNMSLRSRYSVYRIADRVRVKLEEAALSRGKLRFSEYIE
jgi:ribonuclease R